jgi:hypothetical protein
VAEYRIVHHESWEPDDGDAARRAQMQRALREAARAVQAFGMRTEEAARALDELARQPQVQALARRLQRAMRRSPHWTRWRKSKRRRR